MATLNEGEITEDGFLCIKRGGDVKCAMCVVNYLNQCGDNCSFFGDPAGSSPTTLELCQGRTLSFTTFTDNR